MQLSVGSEIVTPLVSYGKHKREERIFLSIQKGLNVEL
jgi:hypothetical protein